MKKISLFIALIILFAGCSEQPVDIEQKEENTMVENSEAKIETNEVDCKAVGYEYDEDSLTYNLVWSDEFDYEGLPDESKWNYNVGGEGWGNRELQYYTEGENAQVKDGKLYITARKEDYKDNEYTSAKLVTKGKQDWLYCKIEVSAKVPSGRGTWPAIWMMPSSSMTYGQWPRSGEIDIMEHVGYEPGKIHGTIHTERYNGKIGTQIGNSVVRDDASEVFHKYSIEWLPDKIKFMVDDKVYFIYKPSNLVNCPTSKEWPYDKEFYLILNLAVGGTWGGARGVDETVFPQDFVIDYVRVYQAEEFKELSNNE